MKRIEIPLIERKDNNVSTKSNVISTNDIFDRIYKYTKLDELVNKYHNNEEFTRNDLISLYDIYNIFKAYYGFYNYYSKIIYTLSTIQKKRNIKEDMAKIFDCDPKEIAMNNRQLDIDPTRYVVLLGFLETSTNEYKYPNLKYISDSCIVKDCICIDNMFPNLLSIGGFGRFYYIKSAYGLESLKSLAHVDFCHLTDAKALSNLEMIFGNADFRSMITAEGLDKLKYIGGDAYFNALEDTSHLSSLEYIGGDVYFDSLDKEECSEIISRVKKKNKTINNLDL